MTSCIGCGRSVRSVEVCTTCWRALPNEIRRVVELTGNRRRSLYASPGDERRYEQALTAMRDWFAARRRRVSDA